MMMVLHLCLQEMGFEEEQSAVLLQKFNTVQAVLASSEAKGKDGAAAPPLSTRRQH